MKLTSRSRQEAEPHGGFTSERQPECCSNRTAIGQQKRVGGALCVLSVWMEERIFFWWPARVTPTLSRSLWKQTEGVASARRTENKAPCRRRRLTLC